MSSNHSEIRAGLIGCGRIARVHVRHLKTLPHVRLVGVCDVDPERARAFAESEKNGPIVQQVRNTILRATAFSPMK